MSGNSVLIDSNIIILASKQEVNIDEILSTYDNFFVSIITYLEVKGFKDLSESEQEIIDTFFENVEILEVGFEIARIVIGYKLNAKKKIKLPDAIILASAKFVNADLLTRNTVDFVGIDKELKIVSL